MNLHVPQSVHASEEVANLMNVSSRLLTAQKNAPVAGIVQDGLVAAFLLTNIWSCSEESRKGLVKGGFANPNTMIKKTVFMDCVTASDISIYRYTSLLKRAQKYYPDYIFKSNNEFTLAENIPGKLMLSIIFPPNLCYTKKTGTSSDFPIVKIEEGVILPDSGPICKKIIGAKENSVVHILCKEYSPELAIQFLTDIQLLTDHWLPYHGFSMGISDCQIRGHEKVAKSLASMELELEKLKSTEEDPEILESKINSYLNKMGNVGIEIANKNMSKDDRNAWTIMRESGAKGNVANVSSTIAFVGQQNIGGKRIPQTLSNGKRSLPYFQPNDISPNARGFVAGNYLHGLNPYEVFFHAITGRDGVVATAVRTGDTGYIHKKISRKMEDLKVYWDGSVRNANGKIIQYLYGDDGLDPQKLYHCYGVKFPFFINSKSVAMTLNKDAERTKQVDPSKESPEELEEEHIELLLSYIIVGSPGIQSEITQNATKSLRNALRRNISEVKIYKCKIPEFCRKILEQFETSKAQHGEMVGSIGAASIGEPTTQLSVLGSERVLVMLYDGTKKIIKEDSIGYIIDLLLKIHCSAIGYLNEESVFSSPDIEVSILTVNTETEKTEWKTVSEISRHPANGKLIKVCTKSGREVTTTLSHSHLARTSKGTIIPKIASNLEKGDRIPVCKRMKTYPEFDLVSNGKYSFDLGFVNGWLFGVFIAKGHIVNSSTIEFTNTNKKLREKLEYISKFYKGKAKTINNKFIISNASNLFEFLGSFALQNCVKIIPSFSYMAPKEFKIGLLRGLFDESGRIFDSERPNSGRIFNKSSFKCIKFIHSSKRVIEGVSLLLTSFDIFGSFVSDSVHQYVISQNYMKRYLYIIGSNLPVNIEKLKLMALEAKTPKIDDIDIIPETGKELERIIGELYLENTLKKVKSNSIRRQSLKNYIKIFERRSDYLGKDVNLDLLKQTVNSDIIWDEIVSIEILDDPKEHVYDFSVDGNNTFMLTNGIFVHNTLNIFHSAGREEKDVSVGVPRVQELLNVTEDPKKPSCSIYFNDEYLCDMAKTSLSLEKQISAEKAELSPKEKEILKSNRKKVSKKISSIRAKENILQQTKIESLRHIQKLSKEFEELKIGTFVKDWEMMYIKRDVDPETGASPVKIIEYKEYVEDWWIKLAKKFYKHKFTNFEPQYWVLRLYFDVGKLFQKEVYLEDISNIIEEITEGCTMCVCSPNNIGIIDVYTNFSEIRSFLKSKKPKTENIIDKELPKRITEENLEFFLCRDDLVGYVKNIKISGISKITKVYPREDKNKEWMLDTKGTNLSDILSIPGIDVKRTTTDDIWSIYRTFGIEAARKFLIQEMTRVLSFDGTYVNPRHIQLLVDSMTDSGDITNVNRNGISRDEGQLKKIMFEQPVDNAVLASAMTEVDELTSIPAAIMYGRIVPAGTGVVEIQSTDQIPVKLPKIPKKIHKTKN